jgi:hypothetical protein
MEITTIFRKYLGWCPNAPALRTAPAVLVVPPEMVHPAEPGVSGSPGSSGRIRHGVSIAAGSLKAMFRDRKLLRFTFLSGLVMLFLIMTEAWKVTHFDYTLLSSFFIPFGDSFMVFDIQLFLIEMVCLSCFTILLAGLVKYRTGKGLIRPLTIREAFAGISTYASSLAALSIIMALTGTFLEAVVSQSQLIGKIELSISIAVFWLPYAYYLPDAMFSALYFSFEIMIINFVLFLLALYIIPVIVLEKKGLVPAFVGSVSLMKKTWREMLGCVVVFGAIILGVAAVALVIGQSPLLLNHDYDFFISMSRGQPLMMAVCFLFLIACWVLMAAGFAVAGIAIADLYSSGTDVQANRGSVTGSASGNPAL